jgi:hypothetical protein
VRTRLLGAALASALSLSALVGTVSAAAPAASAASPVPYCSFGGSGLPIVMNVQAGRVIPVSCTGLTPNNPYVFLQASLLIGIDPQAKALLSGGSDLSPALFLAALAAVPKINPATITVQLSDGNGKLAFDYTVPSSQAPDPNATCPPSKVQFNSGLIGCALAMIDLVTQKPVGAGSAVLEYSGFSFLPPAPTLALSAKKVVRGQSVVASDRPGATSFWWVSTLAALNNLLTGGNSTPKVTVALGPKNPKKRTLAVSNVTAAAATYSNGVFTPPKLFGSFKIPGTLAGGKKVWVTVSQNVLGIGLSNSAVGVVRIAC